MPLLSVVVPVHDVEHLVGECIASILEGTDPASGDLEVVAVDDASVDGSAARLAALAAGDQRVVVVTLPANVGQAEARNRGLDVATGDHVWFVDGDDVLAPGAIDAVRRHLLDGRPDLLVVAHERLHPDGRLEAKGGVPVAGPGAVDLGATDRPVLLRTSPYVWDKVWRRDFLDAHGLRFRGRWYEDQAFVAQALLLVERAKLVPVVCYRYRWRSGSATDTRSDRHLESVEQWERVLRWFEDQPGVAPLRAHLVARMVRALLHVLNDGGRLPPAQRRRYFGQVSRLYRAHRPRRGRGPTGPVAHVTLLAGSYDAYELVRRLRSRGRRADQQAGSAPRTS